MCTIIDKYPNKQLIARVEMKKNRMLLIIMRNKLPTSLNAYKTKNLENHGYGPKDMVIYILVV